mmetsp:Transcript_517/g.1081  ORF Transcript_517/g.1081 Transcript_517/m.1081 type:complete len:231 (+) Transcript_517:1268-1960(+)
MPSESLPERSRPCSKATASRRSTSNWHCAEVCRSASSMPRTSSKWPWSSWKEAFCCASFPLAFDKSRSNLRISALALSHRSWLSSNCILKLFFVLSSSACNAAFSSWACFKISCTCFWNLLMPLTSVTSSDFCCSKRSSSCFKRRSEIVCRNSSFSVSSSFTFPAISSFSANASESCASWLKTDGPLLARLLVCHPLAPPFLYFANSSRSFKFSASRVRSSPKGALSSAS